MSAERSSCLFVDNESKYVSITNSVFETNQMDVLNDYIKKKNTELYEFFITDYFKSSESPLINVNHDSSSLP